MYELSPGVLMFSGVIEVWIHFAVPVIKVECNIISVVEKSCSSSSS